MIRYARSLCIASLLLAALPARGIDLGHGAQAHGFLSQGIALSSDNQVGGDSDDGAGLDLRELGANASWRPDGDWLLSAQALARWAGASDTGAARLDYAFADRRWWPDAESSLGLRLGKIKNSYGFYNTTRDVAHTRPGIVMPQSIYLDRVRDTLLAAPGLALHGGLERPAVSVAWQIGALRPEVDGRDLAKFLTAFDTGRFAGRASWLGQALVETGNGRWRAGLTLGEIRMGYRPGAAGDPYQAGHHRLPLWVASLEHNTEHWSLTAEYGQTRVVARGYGNSPFAAALQRDNTTEAGYLQYTRRLGDGWQGFARYDVLYLDKDDHDGSSFAQNPLIPPHHRFARDLTLGLRRDLGAWALSAEWHRVDGTAWLSPLDNPPTGAVRRWDLFLAQLAWRF